MVNPSHPTWSASLVLVVVCSLTPARAAEQQPAQPAGEAQDVKHVTYVPETVKAEIREEVKQEVLEQAKREGWASPATAAPEWTQRFKFNGDVRGRFERDLFGKGNANTGDFPDFAGINNTTGFDVNGVDLSNDRYLNVDANRTRPRLRARFGVDVLLWQGFSTGIRIGTGDGSTPVSLNQTLGGAPGDFSKYQIWLDRAWIRYAPIDDPENLLSFWLGRFENPFFTSLDFLWSEPVNFDGVALQARLGLGGGFRPFLVAGAFPIFTSAFAFPPEKPSKGKQYDSNGEQIQSFTSLNKWLYAGQLGAEWRPGEFFGLKFGAAFYYFHNIEGRLGSSCDTNLKGFSCDTDESRPLFAQKGNSYRALRTPSALALQAEATNPGLVPRYQYFGLASHYRELVGTLRLDFRISSPLSLWIEGEVVRNYGFKPTEVSNVALNNRGACDATGTVCPFVGGRDGYKVGLSFGSPTQKKQWDWSVGGDYRYLETDAVVDAFTDPDFGLGGTNLKGYVLAASLFVADDVWFRLRWLSANQIVGPTYRADVLQIDLTARF